MKITEDYFGRTGRGERVNSYCIENDHGEWIRVLQYGATLHSAVIRDRKGALKDVVLGLKSVQDYEKSDACLGGLVGRVCNRTKDAKFVLHGVTYHLGAVENGNNLHSLPDGYHLRVWTFGGKSIQMDRASVFFTLHSPDGDQGFPGTCDITVTYTFDNEHTIHVDIETIPDADTMINMTSHTYFNLNGEGSGSVIGHRLAIASDEYLKTDSTNIPLSKEKTKGTIYDFNKGKIIKEDMPEKGYDTCFYLKKSDPCLTLVSEKSGLCLEMSTNQMCVQVYTAGYLNEENGKHVYRPLQGVALEAQYPVNSLNGPEEERPLTEKGKTYHASIAWKFTALEG
jgi:aldose 1-epimerase